jgi:hypothetical protein
MHKFIVSCDYWPTGVGGLRLRALTIKERFGETDSRLGFFPVNKFTSLDKLASSIERRSMRRLKANCEVELAATLSLLDVEAEDSFPSLIFLGTTSDLSAGGLAMVLPSTIIDERFCGGENRISLSLHLPEGTIGLEVNPVRCERISGPNAVQGYLLGTRITNVRQRDQFERYIERLSERGLTETT